MFPTNYHTHTLFCDGHDLPEYYVKEAIRQGFKALGFSAHSPVPFNCKWTLPTDHITHYTNSIRSIQERHSGDIEIYSGFELDFIPGLQDKINATIAPFQPDYIIGSIHFLNNFAKGTPWCIDGPNEEFRRGMSEIFNNDSHAVLSQYFENTRQMVRVLKPDIIGHLDKIKMQRSKDCLLPENHPHYRKEVMQTLEEIAASECIVEINTRGIYKRIEPELYPSTWILAEMSKMKIPVTVNSDAHRPHEVGLYFNETIVQLSNLGFKTIRQFLAGKWIESEI